MSTAQADEDDELPPEAYHPDAKESPSTATLSSSNYRAAPYSVGHLEQKLRIDFVEGGMESGLEYAIATAERRHKKEFDSLLDPNRFDDLFINHDDCDAFLRERFKEIKDELLDLRSNREWWFENMESHLRKRYHRGLGLLKHHPEFPEHISLNMVDADNVPNGNRHIEFQAGVIVRHQDTTLKDYESDQIYTPDQMDNDEALSEFGYELPQPVVIAKSPKSASDSKYPFIPWYGVAICTCGDKLSCPHKSPLCKHEIAAFLLESRDHFDQLVQQAPPRARQLTNFREYADHTPKARDTSHPSF